MRFLCFDNGGETFDRFTVFYKRHGWEPWREYIGASERPFHPQGFGQHGELQRGFRRRSEAAHIGHPIRFSKLPPDVQRFAMQQETTTNHEGTTK